MMADVDHDWPFRILKTMESLADKPLSAAETAILAEKANGLKTKEIAYARGTKEETVRFQLRMIRNKLGAKDTTHACCIAIRKGLI